MNFPGKRRDKCSGTSNLWSRQSFRMIIVIHHISGAVLEKP
jgi:hypothetical protein